jgi:hypothetical protein
MLKLSTFVISLVIGIFNKHFATFISEHTPTVTVKLSPTNSENYVLIPPGEGVLDPWILMVPQSPHDHLVKCAIVDIVVIEVPHAFGGQAEPCLIMSAESVLMLWVSVTHHYHCICDVLRGDGHQIVHFTEAVVAGLVIVFDMLRFDGI